VQSANLKLIEEIEDQKVEVRHKERAPISKKRESSQRLEKATAKFKAEMAKIQSKMNFAWKDLHGVELMSFRRTESFTEIRIKASFDDMRNLVIRIEGMPEEEGSRNASLQPSKETKGMFGS